MLLGSPVDHSASPAIHNASFQAQSVDHVYLACDVTPGSLAAAVEGLWALGAVGANVTIPHKASVLPLVAEATAEARAVGAANTLVRTGAGWRADNTDVDGFATPLRPYAERLRGRSAVVFGAGGAARAVVYALTREFGLGRVTVVARRREQAESLASDLGTAPGGAALAVSTPPDAGGAVRDAALLVNATPLGMGDGRTPWSEAGDFHDGQIVYDLVYRPARTPFLDVTAERGAMTIGGLPMLLAQAAGSYRQWTGRQMPHDVAERAARQALGLP